MSYETDLILRARELQRLQTQRRKLRRHLRAVESDIRHVKKVLKALQLASEGRRPDVAPSRLDAGATGYALPAAEPRAERPAGAGIDISDPDEPDTVTTDKKDGTA